MDVDAETNVPTFFSVLLLLISSLLFGFITWINWKSTAPYLDKWAILSLGFLYIAYDEAFQAHERLIEPIRELLGNENLGVFYYAWVIPGIIVVLFLTVFFFRFLQDLPNKTRTRILVAAVLYVGGALGIELLGGYYAEIHGTLSLRYTMIVALEEGLEMAGLIVLIWALLKYCAEMYQTVKFCFERSS